MAFSGLTPKLVRIASDTSATGVVPGVKFPTVHTMTDSFYITQGALTTNTSTTHLRFRIFNGKTTGNQTTATAGLNSAVRVAMTQQTLGTNYTFSANHWIVVRYSEAGTVAVGPWAVVAYCVDGNV